MNWVHDSVTWGHHDSPEQKMTSSFERLLSLSLLRLLALPQKSGAAGALGRETLFLHAHCLTSHCAQQDGRGRGWLPLMAAGWMELSWLSRNKWLHFLDMTFCAHSPLGKGRLLSLDSTFCVRIALHGEDGVSKS